MLNLTKRQIICLVIAAAVGLPFYFLTKGYIGTSNAATGMVILMLPAFMFAMYEKDGLPLEKILWNIINVKFLKPSIRRYEVENLYEMQEKQSISKGKKEETDVQRKRNSEEDRAKSQPSEDMQLPVVSGYEALERRRGVRRPERKLTRWKNE